jgi:hypothetical protein
MIGLDISPMPVRHGQTLARRLHLPEGEPLWRAGRGFVVRDLPECARSRAQQRGRANRHRIDRGAQPLGRCSGRGRAHSAVFENSPAIYGWVRSSGMFQVPSGTKENCLPSLTGLCNLGCVVPSHKWLGYFH